MGRPAASAAQHTPERLLDAAEDAFARHGLHAARLEDIAAAVGIRRSSLLYHYGSKEALYAAVVERTFARLGRALAQAMARGVDFRQRFDDVLAAFLTFLEGHPNLAPIVLRELVADDGPGRDLVAHQVAPVLDLVERFIRIDGHGVLAPRLPVRAALLHLASAAILRRAAGDLAPALWGDGDHDRDLAHRLFFAQPPPDLPSDPPAPKEP